jgi:hypothetical protein
VTFVPTGWLNYTETDESSLQGIGTSEKILIEIMCTRSNQQIQAIKAEYDKMYKRDLEADLKSETGGNFEKLLVSMSVGKH